MRRRATWGFCTGPEEKGRDLLGEHLPLHPVAQNRGHGDEEGHHAHVPHRVGQGPVHPLKGKLPVDEPHQEGVDHRRRPYLRGDEDPEAQGGEEQEGEKHGEEALPEGRPNLLGRGRGGLGKVPPAPGQEGHGEHVHRRQEHPYPDPPAKSWPMDTWPMLP